MKQMGYFKHVNGFVFGRPLMYNTWIEQPYNEAVMSILGDLDVPIIFDADIGLANVEVMFGTIPQYSLNDLIYHDKEIEDIITDGPEGVGFISGGSGIMGLNNLTPDQISYLVKSVEKLSSMADVVIVDTGAGISDSVMEFVASSPEILLVTTPEPSSLTDAYSLLKMLYRNPKYDKNESVIHVITNRAMSQSEGKMVFDKLDSVVKQFLDGFIEYIGIIPQDAMLEKAVRIQKPVRVTSMTGNCPNRARYIPMCPHSCRNAASSPSRRNPLASK